MIRNIPQYFVIFCAPLLYDYKLFHARALYGSARAGESFFACAALVAAIIAEAIKKLNARFVRVYYGRLI